MKIVSGSTRWDCMDLCARRRYLLKYCLWTDVEFQVGETKAIIKAHRLVLASASPVFRVMMYGALAEKKSPICIPDVSHEVFNLMLEFIYSDKIGSIKIENLAEINYVTQKYLLPRFMNFYMNGLMENKPVENDITYYEYAVAAEYQPLIDKCLEAFRTNTQAVLDTESALSADMETLLTIFSQDQINISEIELLKFIKKYAAANGIEVNTRNQMESDGMNSSIWPLLQRIRFLTLSIEELTNNHLLLREFLSESDMLLLMLNINNHGSAPMPEGLSTSREGRCSLTTSYVHAACEVGARLMNSKKVNRQKGCRTCTCEADFQWVCVEEDTPWPKIDTDICKNIKKGGLREKDKEGCYECKCASQKLVCELLPHKKSKSKACKKNVQSKIFEVMSRLRKRCAKAGKVQINDVNIFWDEYNDHYPGLHFQLNC